MRLPLSVAASRPAANDPLMCAAASAVAGSSGIGAGDQIERERDVAHRLRHRPDGIVVGIERHHAGAAGQPARRPDGRERGKAGRIRQRVAGVGAEAERARLAATAVALPPLEPDGAERRIVGVADRAADGADAEVAERKLVEIGLAEQDGAALLHARGDARIETRMMIDERARAAGRRQLDARRCCP